MTQRAVIPFPTQSELALALYELGTSYSVQFGLLVFDLGLFCIFMLDADLFQSGDCQLPSAKLTIASSDSARSNPFDFERRDVDHSVIFCFGIMTQGTEGLPTRRMFFLKSSYTFCRNLRDMRTLRNRIRYSNQS